MAAPAVPGVSGPYPVGGTPPCWEKVWGGSNGFCWVMMSLSKGVNEDGSTLSRLLARAFARMASPD